MLPYVLYYGNTQNQMPNVLTFTPYLSEARLVSFPGPMISMNSANFYFSGIDSQPSKSNYFTYNIGAKEDMKFFIQHQQNIEKNQQKPVKRIQNPYRNIYTNITNLILNFIISRKKSGQLLQQIDPSLVDEKLFKFYKYVRDIKTHFCSYFNVEKLKRLFRGVSIPNYNTEFHNVLNVAAKIILQEKMSICIITSKKLCPGLRMEHLNARRVILNILKYGKYVDKDI